MGCSCPNCLSKEKKSSEVKIDSLEKEEMDFSDINEKENISGELLEEGVQKHITFSNGKFNFDNLKTNKVRRRSTQNENDHIKQFTMNLGVIEKNKTMTKNEYAENVTESCETHHKFTNGA